MQTAAQLDLNYSQISRLKHIDFCLFFTGCITRTALIKHFGISSAAATRDISQYKELTPDNIVYDQKDKEYRISSSFSPYYDHDPEESILQLSKEVNLYDFLSEPILCENPASINRPDVQILATVTRSIYQARPLKITYYSLTTGKNDREIVPFALVNNGDRWHVRGFDRKRKTFTDFVINRIKKASILEAEHPQPHERKNADNQWNRIVDLEITPHPNLSESQKEAILYEYRMKDGFLKIQVRANVCGYFLRQWNIDCSSNHKLSEIEYHLWLKNNAALYGVESAEIAPGYKDLKTR